MDEKEKGMDPFIAWLTTTLKEKGMKQADLEGLTDLTESQVSKYVHGVTTPRWQNILRIAEALDCHIEFVPNE